MLTKCIFQSGVGAAINSGFSLRRSVLWERNAIRNSAHNLHQPIPGDKNNLEINLI